MKKDFMQLTTGFAAISYLDTKNGAEIGDTYSKPLYGTQVMVVGYFRYLELENYVKKLEKRPYSVDYKDAIKFISNILEESGIDDHTRHEFEREAIREWGGHNHTNWVRRFFI
jgi:hypothetical protein